MQKLLYAKISALLLGISVVTVTTVPALAENLATTAVRSVASAEAARKAALKEKAELRKEAIKAEIATVREKWASKTAELKTRLQTFKDQQKAAIAERINNTLDKINQNQTAQMKKHLKLMSTILDKLENRVNSNTPDIKNSAGAKDAIDTARLAIASASAAVTDQEKKTYLIQATSEAKLRQEAKTQRDLLHSDLQEVRKMVIAAKQAIANAIKVAKSGFVVNPSEIRKEGTFSGQQ